jgi:hypothetical protein
MVRIVLSLITFIFLSIPSSFASDEGQLQGYGAFSNLNKDWMLMALYTELSDTELSGIESGNKAVQPNPQRLEIKIATKKLSPRRFRSLWLETLAVEHGTEKVASMSAELQQFFSMLKGPLKAGDSLVLERSELGTQVKINYHTLATLSADFLPTLVQSLVGKHPPTQALKAGLIGEDSLRGQANLSIRFERLEPSLPRIAEISRWGKHILASR